MGYNKDNFKRIRADYETKSRRAEAEADARRAELHQEIPELREMDQRLSAFGLRIMKSALTDGNTEAGIADLRAENERIRCARAELLRRHGFPADYTDPQYECNKCRDTGYVGIQMCDCMRRALVMAGMRSSGLSSLLERQSFENFSLQYYEGNPEEARKMEASYRKLVSYARSFSMGEGRMPGSLLFLGGTGLGKTHLSTAIARTVIERGYDVYYNSAVGMISDFEFRRFGNGLAGDGMDDTSRYTECDLLIIDDLGTEVVNQFTLSCLYHVINTRLNIGLPTIISTNLSSMELRKAYSDRISSRLMGEFQVIPFYGTDIRRQKLKNS